MKNDNNTGTQALFFSVLKINPLHATGFYPLKHQKISGFQIFWRVWKKGRHEMS